MENVFGLIQFNRRFSICGQSLHTLYEGRTSGIRALCAFGAGDMYAVSVVI